MTLETTRKPLTGDAQLGTITSLRKTIKGAIRALQLAEKEGYHLRCVTIARDLAHYYESLDAAINGETIDRHAQRRNSAARGW